MVGTRCEWVTRCCWISLRVSSASQLFMSTDGTPALSGMIIVTSSGAAWYSGPVVRLTESSSYPYIRIAPGATGSGRSRKTPLGRPVVPEV